MAQHGGEYLLRGGRAESVEGTALDERVVMGRFSSFAGAAAWYLSEEDAEAKKLRQAAATSVQALTEDV